MRLFNCPHCDAVVEFLDAAAREPQCDCGAILEPIELDDQPPADGGASLRMKRSVSPVARLAPSGG
jgi:hypothetical protein